MEALGIMEEKAQQLNIPDRIKVGYQKRADTKEGA